MKKALIIVLLMECVAYHAQNLSPETAGKIKPVGSYVNQLIKGEGVRVIDFTQSENSGLGTDSIFRFQKGFVCWLTFDLENSDDLCFTIKSQQPAVTRSSGLLDETYLQFVLYQFDGTGAQLDQAIKLGEIRPTRIAMLWGSSISNCVHGSGLSPFETDTVGEGAWQSGFLKPISAKLGARFFLVIQVLCSQGNCKLNIENHFSLWFGSSSPPPPLILRNLEFDLNKLTLNGNNSNLEKVIELLKSDSSLTVRIEAYYYDEVALDSNLRASYLRSRSVYNYLKYKGVDEDQISFKGCGNTKPIVSNNAALEKEVNPRVELAFQRKKILKK